MCLLLYNVPECEHMFTLELNTAESSNYIEKCFKQIKLNFLQKTQWAHVFISSRSGARGHQGYAIFEIMNLNGKIGSL